MQKAIDDFRETLTRVEHLGGLYEALTKLTTSVVDASDLLRAQIVLIVSAFDYYIHEVTALGMVEVWSGQRQPTSAFRNYRVPTGSVTSGVNGWFEAEVRERHGFLSFQQPDKVADAIRLFWGGKLWQEVAVKMGMTEEVVKSQLTLIVTRRNKIAHEADLDPSYPSTRWPISQRDVASAYAFIRALGESIHEVVV
jgi:hypothetical protein